MPLLAATPPRIEREIESVFDPGQYVPERGCSTFVDDLGEVAAEVAKLVSTAPSAAAGLYETFLAGCYGKAEEVDNSSGVFGDFVGTTVLCGWITASQAAGADAGETAARLLGWMEEDQYGFFHRLDEHAVTVLNAAGLAAMAEQVRARFNAAGRAGPVSGEPSPNRGHAVRRWAEVLRTLYAAQRDVHAYIELAEQTGLTAKECHTVATMLGALDAYILGSVVVEVPAERSAVEGLVLFESGDRELDIVDGVTTMRGYLRHAGHCMSRRRGFTSPSRAVTLRRPLLTRGKV